MNLIVDSKEPVKYYNWMSSTFPGIEVDRKSLPEGDYQSSTCLFERKTWEDLYGSLVGTRNKPGRFWSQIERMSTHDKHCGVIVTGNLSTTIDYYSTRSIPFDPDMLLRALRDVHVRYGFSIIYYEDVYQGLAFMVKTMKAFDDGKCNIPIKRNPDVLMARLLGLTISQWKDLHRWYPTIPDLIEASETDYQRVRGIGTQKASKIKRVLTGEIE